MDKRTFAKRLENSIFESSLVELVIERGANQSFSFEEFDKQAIKNGSVGYTPAATARTHFVYQGGRFIVNSDGACARLKEDLYKYILSDPDLILNTPHIRAYFSENRSNPNVRNFLAQAEEKKAERQKASKPYVVVDQGEKMKSYHEENRSARKEAEQAREEFRELASEALRYARQCKGENVDPMIRALASNAGKMAAEARKEAKEKAAKAASARRIACVRAMGAKPVPPLPSEAFNGGKMPTPPNRKP